MMVNHLDLQMGCLGVSQTESQMATFFVGSGSESKVAAGRMELEEGRKETNPVVKIPGFHSESAIIKWDFFSGRG